MHTPYCLEGAGARRIATHNSLTTFTWPCDKTFKKVGAIFKHRAERFKWLQNEPETSTEACDGPGNEEK